MRLPTRFISVQTHTPSTLSFSSNSVHSLAINDSKICRCHPQFQHKNIILTKEGKESIYYIQKHQVREVPYPSFFLVSRGKKVKF
ncbi:hypothetical protein RJT34_05621 [Clitoria ternatea]|uniref:Uncharacterized protein n=1 Tax=Clitoria ternatea TaxID=43366 RepID=A0AAN9K0U0_CLITE